MKQITQKVKEFFNRISESIKKYLDLETSTAIIILLFYCCLFIGASAFVVGLVKALNIGSALFLLLGSYFSIRIIYTFIRDFVRLIKFYIKKKDEK